MDWFTRNGSDIYGKQLVYVTGGENALNRCIAEQSELRIVKRILEKANCAVRVGSGELPADEIRDYQLVVVIITSELFENPQAIETVKAAQRLRVPLLPLMVESGLESRVNTLFNDLQCLFPFSQDSTQEPFDKKLQFFLDSVLIDDELEKEVKRAFDGYIFLSYRKKDRKYVQQLIRLIHSFDFCRDIAIWYDEALIPGENYTEAIEQSLLNADIFLLMVTPNILEEGNYVKTIEYPAALSHSKPVLPVEVVPTDAAALKNGMELEKCIKAEDTKRLRKTLEKYIKSLPKKNHFADANHIYLMGIAYLYGIDVETDIPRGLKLLAEAAEKYWPFAASKLAELYSSGGLIEQDLGKALYWLGKKVELYDQCPNHLSIYIERIRARLKYECELRRAKRYEESEQQVVRLICDCESFKDLCINKGYSEESVSWALEIESRAYSHLAQCRKELGYPDDEIESIIKLSSKTLRECISCGEGMDIEQDIITGSHMIYQNLEAAQKYSESAGELIDSAEELFESITERLKTEKVDERRLAHWKRNRPLIWYIRGKTSAHPEERIKYYSMAEEAFIGLVSEFPGERSLKQDLAAVYADEFEYYIGNDTGTAFLCARRAVDYMIEFYSSSPNKRSRDELAGTIKKILSYDSSVFDKDKTAYCRGVEMMLDSFFVGIGSEHAYICVFTLDNVAYSMLETCKYKYSLYLYDYAYYLCQVKLAENTRFAEQLIQLQCGLVPAMAYINISFGELENAFSLLADDVAHIDRYLDRAINEESVEYAFRHTAPFITSAEKLLDCCLKMKDIAAAEKCRILIIKMELAVCRGACALGDTDKLNQCLNIIAQHTEELRDKKQTEIRLIIAKTLYYRSNLFRLIDSEDSKEMTAKDAGVSLDIYDKVFSANPSAACARDYYLCGMYVHTQLMDKFLPTVQLDNLVRHIIVPVIYLCSSFPKCEEYTRMKAYCEEQSAILIKKSCEMVDELSSGIQESNNKKLYDALKLSQDIIKGLMEDCNLFTRIKDLYDYISTAITMLNVLGYSGSDGY